ncbi:hypothetical protein GVAV_001483 [Gurleya vavrai]
MFLFLHLTIATYLSYSKIYINEGSKERENLCEDESVNALIVDNDNILIMPVKFIVCDIKLSKKYQVGLSNLPNPKPVKKLPFDSINFFKIQLNEILEIFKITNDKFQRLRCFNIINAFDIINIRTKFFDLYFENS